ncbi:protein LSM14 B-like isoform X1 [Dinothrombium tinctorium]|uniref:Protein LSM14 B-like isoform X1 n=1 Tax=Dinothrombium tinctorium TaxID=1965070 RepID=A0A443RNV1_9ACAR|nr:protein LSM14 B-like isoform X1 [Dinothrombium tinctorium]
MSIPYLGSKINLVSKSEIRYEGILYTIDPKDSTIALAKVRSFGTENRKTDKPVAPREEIYEYIIFRASDIKDLVVEVPPSTTALSDPAIIQAQSMTGGTNLENAAFGTNSAVSIAGIQSTTSTLTSGASSDQRSNNLSSVFTAPVSGTTTSTASDQTSSGAFTSTHEFRSGKSTPTALSRRSPLSESGNQVHAQTSRDRSLGSQFSGRENRESRPAGYNRMRGPSGDRHIPPSHYNQYRRPNLPVQRQGPPPNFRGGRQGPPPPRRVPVASRPQAYRMPPNQKNKSESVIKIDGEYDFEKANQEFQELESKLQKINLDSDAKKDESTPTPATNDSTSNEKKENEEDVVFYDKSKSFFDQISCEAIERTKGKVNRIDWKQERKLNAETFGLSTNYNRRGGSNYRGRGYGGFSRQNYYNQRNDFGGNRSYGNAGGGDGRRSNAPPRGNRFTQDVEHW